eukprot:scaffold16573_cov119-Skeletonema_marinoi.AAC.5
MQLQVGTNLWCIIGNVAVELTNAWWGDELWIYGGVLTWQQGALLTAAVLPLVLFFHLPFDVLVGRAYFTYAGITTKWYLNVSPIILLAVALACNCGGT